MGGWLISSGNVTPRGTKASARKLKPARLTSRNSKLTSLRRARPHRTPAAGRNSSKTLSTNSLSAHTTTNGGRHHENRRDRRQRVVRDGGHRKETLADTHDAVWETIRPIPYRAHWRTRRGLSPST